MSDAFARLKEALSDRYTIERELGAGEMATVYLAHDRKVAIKVLRPELAAVLGAERRHPLDSLPVHERPYWQLSRFNALAG